MSNNAGISGFIDKNTTIEGNIKFNQSFRIDGKFKGKITEGKSLIIGESGEVEGDISVEYIVVNGSVKGTIIAKEKVEIYSKGKLNGEVSTPKLIIEEGAYFQGSSKMMVKQEDKPENHIKKEEKIEKQEKNGDKKKK